MKTKKAQGLPISTIILMVLAIVVLAAVLLFFFTGFGKPTGTLSNQQALSNCQSKCSIIASAAITNKTQVAAFADKQGFCTNMTVDGSVTTCDKFILCNVESAGCMLGCIIATTNNATCP